MLTLNFFRIIKFKVNGNEHTVNFPHAYPSRTFISSNIKSSNQVI